MIRKEMDRMSGRTKRQDLETYEIVFVGVMAAMVYVVTLFRFQLLESKVHFANAVCLLCGMLLGPVQGGVAAGLGSALFDGTTGYDLIQTLITFVSKFMMAFVCGLIVHKDAGKSKGRLDRTVLACVLGALTYVALYMLKTGVYGAIAGNIWAPIVSKFPASIINAGVAIVAAPIFYRAVLPALKAGGILGKLRQSEG